jgi:hypothetical protein
MFALAFVGGCSPDNSDQQSRSLDRGHEDPRCAEPTTFDAREPHHRVLSSSGVVSSEAVAKEVAYSYLKAVYPDDRHLRPMKATLNDGVWTVNGTLPKGWLGGVAGIAFCQSNGRVLEIAHGK